MGDLFGGSESEAPRILEAFSGQSGLLKELAEAAQPKGLEAIGLAGQPFGQLLASLSQFQQRGLGQIGDVLGRGMVTESPLFKKGQEAISGALEGFDPFKDLRFQALQTNLGRELKRAKDRIAARTSAKDQFFGGGRLDQEREVEEFGFGQMASLAGQLEGQSRQLQLQAAPLARQFATLAGEEPRSRLMDQLFGLGAAPRQFEQEQISAEQQEQQRILQELSNIGLKTGLQTTMFQPDFFVPSFGPSPFSQLAGGLGGIEGLFGGSSFGGEGGSSFLGGLSPTGSSGGDIQAIMQLAAMFSDATLKREMKTIPDALDKINQLDGKTFRYIGGLTSGGVVAQEIERVLPEAVGVRNGFKTVDYTAILGLLINAVQELSRKVA